MIQTDSYRTSSLVQALSKAINRDAIVLRGRELGKELCVVARERRLAEP